MIGFDWSEWAILRFVGASFILWLCYYLLLDRKAPFSQCRIYLIYSVVIAGVVSTVRIPVYPTPQAIHTSLAPLAAREEMGQRETIPLAMPPETGKVAPSLQDELSLPTPSLQDESSMQDTPFYLSLDYWLIAKVLYGLGVCVLLIYLATEMVRIWCLTHIAAKVFRSIKYSTISR